MVDLFSFNSGFAAIIPSKISAYVDLYILVMDGGPTGRPILAAAGRDGGDVVGLRSLRLGFCGDDYVAGGRSFADILRSPPGAGREGGAEKPLYMDI